MGEMRNFVPFSCAIVATGLSALPAAAQLGSKSSVAETIPLRFRVGALQFSNGKTRDLVGARAYGGEVDLVTSKADSSALTAGYFEARRNGKSARIVPLLTSKSTDSSAPVSNLTGFYSTTGVGVYFIDAAGSGFKAKFGGYLGMGLRLTGGLFVEAQYHYVSGNVNGVTPNGVGIFIGRRN